MHFRLDKPGHYLRPHGHWTCNLSGKTRVLSPTKDCLWPDQEAGGRRWRRGTVELKSIGNWKTKQTQQPPVERGAALLSPRCSRTRCQLPRIRRMETSNQGQRGHALTTNRICIDDKHKRLFSWIRKSATKAILQPPTTNPMAMLFCS